ncbi:MAG: hypothetical protein K6C05_10125 [Anaerovibrio sp.]|uniref:hypothetical protein n=1 Tax=Anaerovibrio sp. TaxID=1872532 RepID=UPI0025E68730|nr:hypothetical protein [Anaerovibrio sp.]MCR5177185.1 hypothetical protein [Anaerovibrio sp.]
MILKKAIACFVMGILAFAVLGCGDMSQNDINKQPKAINEEIIKNIIGIWGGNDIEAKREICRIDRVPTGILVKTRLIDATDIEGYLRQKHQLQDISVSQIRQDGDYAMAHISYTDGSAVINENLGFCYIDGQWCMGLNEIKSAANLDISCSDSNIDVAANIGYSFDNNPVIILDLRSKTGQRYAAGWVEPVTAILVTDKGEFPARNFGIFISPERVIMISSQEAVRLTLPFKDAIGTPREIRLIGFNGLDSRGLPVSFDNEAVIFHLSGGAAK